MSKPILVLTVVVCVLCVAIAFTVMYQKDADEGTTSDYKNGASENDVHTTPDPQEARSYTAPTLGVTFTYRPRWVDYPVVVREEGNTIYLGVTQRIEVFEKDPTQSLEEAIAERFLKEYDSKLCWVVTYDASAIPSISGAPSTYGYERAGITYPAPTDPNAPFWEQAEMCPPYSESNGIRYFMMNPAVPDRFVFVDVGQDSPATDGVSEDGDWSASIQILAPTNMGS